MLRIGICQHGVRVEADWSWRAEADSLYARCALAVLAIGCVVTEASEILRPEMASFLFRV
jgi:hypothetical protein